MENNNSTNKFDKSLFGKDFKWGVSTSAFQVEGAHDEGGKGFSVWDKFSEQKGTISSGHHAQISCDFYNRYEEDIKLIKSLNISNFRFSISWSRVIPDGIGAINQKGIDYYNRVIDCCIENNIEPWVTLYHWDLPHELELKGGWTNRKIVDWFSNYVTLCAKHFGDRVKHWMVLNEPMVFTGAGYFLGVHAPGKRGLNNFLPALHHSVLCQAQGIRILKSEIKDAEIGTTISCSHIDAYDNKLHNLLAAERIDILLNRLFIEPLLGLGYPVIHKKLSERLDKYILPGDDKLMKADFDFLGLQNYTREVVKHSWYTPYLKAKLIGADKRKVDTTLMNWEVYPEAIYNVLKKFNKYPQIKKIIITENGAAFNDNLIDGKVSDEKRLEYLKNDLQQVLRAKTEGVRVEGYFVWSLLDNFEWTEGYHPRFGIVYVDFETQQRTIKDSGNWFKIFLKERNLNHNKLEKHFITANE
jgi:beta-glucosidase